MKSKYYLYPVLIILFTIASCTKFNDQDTPGDKTFEDLVIYDDFTWETTRNVSFNITGSNATMVSITSSDGRIIYNKGYFNRLEEYYKTTLHLPAYLNKVKINGNNVEFTGDQVTFNLDDAMNPMKETTVAPSYPTDGLVSLWHFDENSGNTAYDSQGENNGNISGAEWITGISGSALDYNNEDGGTIIPKNSSLNITGNQLSLSVWFKLSEIGDDGCFIFDRTKYVVRIDQLGKLLFGIYNPDWSYANIDWTNRIIDTDWHNLINTYDGSIMKMYLDGELLGTSEASGNLRSTTSDVYIGNQSSINFFNGRIDEVAIYNRALTVQEVSKVYNTTPNPGGENSGLISDWPLNENSGEIAYDQTGNNNATIFGAQWEPGVNGSCLKFNGISNYAVAPNAENLNPVSQVTVMAWAKTYENKTAKIAQKGDWDGHGVNQDKWSGWKGHIRLENNQSESIDWQNGIPVFDEWYHVCVTYDGNIMKLYVNGQLRNSKEVSGNLKINNRTFSIGSDNGAQKFFNGCIDDVRFYGTALDQTTIQAIYNNQQASDDTDGDGITDQDDDYPLDPSRAFNNFYPAAGYESLAFEDLWPGTGDYDFNDLVLDYRFTLVTNAGNKVTDINGSFVVRAIGAGFSNGFGFQFDNSPIQPSDLIAEGYVLTENYISLNESGTENNQEKITFIVFDNAKTILLPAGGFGVNVDPTAPYVDPDTVNLYITFSNLEFSVESLNLGSFNPFLIIDGNRDKEVHLPDYPPTSLANTSLFGTQNDDSNPQTGKYYKTANNLPWAICIAESYNYTKEKSRITSAYLKCAEWAESSGSLYNNWYLDISGYRNEGNIYQVPAE